MRKIFCVLVITCSLLASCGKVGPHKQTNAVVDFIADCCEVPRWATIYLVPMDGISDSEVKKLQKTLQEKLLALQHEKTGMEDDWPYYYEVKILPRVSSPDSCLNDIKSRYRSTKLIEFLKSKHQGVLDDWAYMIGVTDKDISLPAHNSKDYGIMGLSYMPGTTSVISTFRLRNKKDLWKLALHEYSHGYFKMPHCSEKDPKCIMKDAEGGNPHFELKETFCEVCMEKFSEYPD